MVSFICIYQGVEDYKVYDRTTHEDSRIRLTLDTGEISGVGRDATADEKSAIDAYKAAQHAEYLIWKAEFDRKHAA